MDTYKELEVTTLTTSLEDVYEENDSDTRICSTNWEDTWYVAHDPSGLRIRFGALVPITFGDNGEPRIWGGNIALNGGEMEFPKVDYKLRATARKSVKLELSCNRNEGTINQNDIFLMTFKLPEHSIKKVELNLIVDGSTYEVPLYKAYKTYDYWIGKDTEVPDREEFLKSRYPEAPPLWKKKVSPFDQLPEGLKSFLVGENGLRKLIHPHAVALLRDLSTMQVDKMNIIESADDGGLTDVIAEEIVRRFHESNHHTVRHNSGSAPTE